MIEWLEYAAVWTILKMLGLLPRGGARGLAALSARILFALLPQVAKDGGV